MAQPTRDLFIPPPFEWVDIPAGRVTLADDAGTFSVQPFKIAKYPVTYAQFQLFVDAPDGFGNDAWWQGLAKRAGESGTQAWLGDKNPRENVSWFDAIAYCRWLSGKLGYEVRLPYGWEWQWAAQGDDGRKYPWGNAFDRTKCNTWQSGNRQPTPVDRYPSGASFFGVMDMSGNVWEWCANEYDAPGNCNLAGAAPRVVRGGSWGYNDVDARVTVRGRCEPDFRSSNFGFRLALGSMDAVS